MTTDPSDLPSFDGRPVPWITRWTGEVMPDRNQYSVEIRADGSFRVAYPDGKNTRDLLDILWQREGIGRKGEPMWADVSTYRQRAAMARGLCQVCGTKINAETFLFLIPRDAMEWFDEDTPITMQAPVCEECVPLALKLCPALKRNGYQLLKVINYDLWGVMGQVTYRTEQGFGKIQATVSFADNPDYGPDFRLNHVMAQQSVIKLGKHVVVESFEGRAPQPEYGWQELLHPETTINPAATVAVINTLAEALRKDYS